MGRPANRPIRRASYRPKEDEIVSLFKSVLDPSASVMVGLGEGAVVIAVYQHFLPNAASIRVSSTPHDGDIESARRAAAWTSAGVIGFLFLLTRDKNAALIGGMTLAGIDYMIKHSNGFNPATGKLHSTSDDSIASEAIADNVYPMPEYADQMDSVGY